MNDPRVTLQDGMLHAQAGRWDQAAAVARHLLQNGPDAGAWHLLGLSLVSQGHTAQAIDAFRQAVLLAPGNPVAHCNLGQALAQAGAKTDAETSLRQALNLQAAFPEALYNLANLLKETGRTTEALVLYAEAIRLRPSYAQALFNYANALTESGLPLPAVDAYRRALQCRPGWPDALVNLANAFCELNRHDEAAHCYEQVAQIDPTYPDVEISLALTHIQSGRIALARGLLHRAATREPQRWLLRLQAAALAEQTPNSATETAQYLRHLTDTIDTFRTQPRPVDLAKLHNSSAEPPMDLAYLGTEERPLKEAWANLFLDRIPPGDAPARHGGLPRVALVVTRGHEGVFLKCLGGLIERHDPAQLRLSVVCSLAGANFLKQKLRHPAVCYLVIPQRLDEAAATIRAERFDVLHYWEVGTDSVNYFLPFLRLARVQGASWGWPSTSGNPRLDYFLSSALLEAPDAERFYTERLIRLRTLPTCYRFPPVPARLRPRETFGLSPNTRLYLCPQNLRKFHPDFDPLITGVLRTDPQGEFVLLADQRPLRTKAVLERLRRAMPDVAGRLKVIPRLPEEDYLNLLAVADVILDTPHYGGGANTILDAVATGTPTVTLIGQQARGRWAGTVCQQLGLDECVATNQEQYIQKAVAVATNDDYQIQLRHQIATQRGPLFDDPTAATTWQEWLLHEASRG